MYSAFDIFKIGIGPSSSHTVGPMKAAKQFVDDLIKQEIIKDITAITVDVHGSLALTGKGHNTDTAIILGLGGFSPDNVDLDAIPDFLQRVASTEQLPIGLHAQTVEFKNDAINFIYQALPLHENGMKIHAFNGNDLAYSKTYYSIGGGFIVEEEDF